MRINANNPKLGESIVTSTIAQIIDDTSYKGAAFNIGDYFARIKLKKLLKENIQNPLTDANLINTGIIKYGYFQGKNSIKSNTALLNKIANTFNNSNLVLNGYPDYNDLSIAKNSVNIQDINSLNSKYKDSIPIVKETLSKIVERGNIAENVKAYYKYECLVCKCLGQNATSFNKKGTNIPYIEAHHIDFLSNLNKGANNFSNFITVCPNHHREIHYGNVYLKENKTNYVVYEFDKKQIKINK